MVVVLTVQHQVQAKQDLLMLQLPMARFRAMTEALVEIGRSCCWNAGATPSIVMCGSSQKQTISTFTGNATKFQDVDDKKLPQR